MTMTMMSRFAFFGLLIFLWSAAYAQESNDFRRGGKWDIGVWTAGATGEEYKNSFAEVQFWDAGLFIGRSVTDEIWHGWLRGRLEYGFNLIPIVVQARPEAIRGGGFEPVVLRWNSSRHLGRFTPYVELGGGVVITNTNLPSGDTSSFNFTAKGGGGVYVVTTNRHSLDIGCRWWHISNANLGMRNPEFNGLQFSVGYHWYR